MFSYYAIKKACEKHILLKQHMFFTYQRTHVNLRNGLHEIFCKPDCRKFMSITNSYKIWGKPKKGMRNHLKKEEEDQKQQSLKKFLNLIRMTSVVSKKTKFSMFNQFDKSTMIENGGN